SLDNDRLLDHIICQDVMNIVMHADSVLAKVLPANNKFYICVNSLASWNDCREMQQGFIDEYNENLMLKVELAKKEQMVEKTIFDEVLLRCSRLENRNVKLELKLQHQKESFLNNKPLNNQNASEILDAHIDYIKHSWEHADILREIVEHARALRPLDSDLDSACQTFTIAGKTYHLTRITSTKVVPFTETTSKSVTTQNPQNKVVVSKISNNSEPSQSWGSNVSDVPSTSLVDFRFENDQIAKIMGYGDYQMGNVMISWVYYVEGLVLEVATLELAVSTGTPSSTSVDQDTPSPSTSQPPQSSQSLVASPFIVEGFHDIEVAHLNNDPFVGVPIPEPTSEEFSSRDVIPTNVHSVNQPPKLLNKWTTDHPLDNVIGNPSQHVSTRHQLQNKALFCYLDAFLFFVEPKNYKEDLKESCWIEAMQEELNEFKRLEVWELIPRPDRVMIITLKWIFKGRTLLIQLTPQISIIFINGVLRRIKEKQEKSQDQEQSQEVKKRSLASHY
ncbi:retrovirus-related pol polyprotein from transposon TNT 1-94, partial [Tanacetum coccineum]